MRLGKKHLVIFLTDFPSFEFLGGFWWFWVMLLIIIIVRGKNGRQGAHTEKLGSKIWSDPTAYEITKFAPSCKQYVPQISSKSD